MMIGKAMWLTSALKMSLPLVVTFSLLSFGCSQESSNDDTGSNRDGGADSQVADASGQDANSDVRDDAATGGSAGAEAGPDGNDAGMGGSSGEAGGEGGAGGMATGGQAGAPPAGGGGGAPSFSPCKKVLHIGDSLSARDVTELLVKAYQKEGVTAIVDAYGSRSIFTKHQDDPYTGEDAAKKYSSEGYSGCWVIALGTNDASPTQGKPEPCKKRIDAMMNAIDPTGKARVMWVNVYGIEPAKQTFLDAFPGWNEALIVAKSRWPNMRVYDWASVAKTGVAPYSSDGVHHTSEGYKVRNARIAKAVVTKGVGP